ncbi:MAG TPA: DUF177 domain-containing protein [Silvibacterium sp.]|nr:DUF177 domain-containing protein [Silvibacterium sp.]
MFIPVLDLEKEPVRFDIAFQPGAIDFGFEANQKGPLAVKGQADLIEEKRIGEARGSLRTVEDIRLRGSYAGDFEIPCARCLDPVAHTLSGEFDLLFRPLGADADASERAITTPETEIGYYQDGGLALEDVVREQVFLSLPARSLCREDCKGICPRCGKNLNSESCTCDTAPADPRWSALSDLASRMKT